MGVSPMLDALGLGKPYIAGPRKLIVASAGETPVSQ
jgi:hypothetical protein